VAEQILAIAFAHDIKVREDADLVQILEAVDLDSEIPLEALAAVAEILSYVYRANNRLAMGEPGPTDLDQGQATNAETFRQSLLGIHSATPPPGATPPPRDGEDP